MQIKGFDIVNEDKWQRAIHGTIGRESIAVGGVGEDASDEEKLASYDRLAGLIKKDGHIVKNGAFWDFAGKKVRKTPVVIFLLKDLQGKTIEVPEGEEIPLEARAAEIQQGRKVEAAKVRADRVTGKKSSKKAQEDEE